MITDQLTTPTHKTHPTIFTGLVQTLKRSGGLNQFYGPKPPPQWVNDYGPDNFSLLTNQLITRTSKPHPSKQRMNERTNYFILINNKVQWYRNQSVHNIYNIQ
jgi:hypothetical protein